MPVRAGVVALVVWSVVAAAAHGHAPAGARGGEPVASAAVSPSDTVALRQRYFGAANVDPRTGAVRRDRIVLSWVGVSNFAMAIRGHVVLLDAWIPRGAHSGYVPSSPAELAALRPSHVLIGHAHFDHAADAVPIAEASGATLVGTAEQCAELRPRATGMPPRCVEALPAGAAPGARAEVDVLRGVGVTILKHVHSGAKAPDLASGYHVPVLPPPAGTSLTHPPTPQDLAHLVQHAPDAEAGTVLYRFAVGDTTLVWHDSSGPLTEDAPEAFAALRALRPVDVQVGAIQGFNQVTNGLRDPRRYVEELRPRVFVPAHHDDWAAGITTRGEAYREPLARELAQLPDAERPEVRFLSDPADYVRPGRLTFPVALEPPRLTRRCHGARLRAALAGDLADVEAVTFRLGGRRIHDTSAPFAAALRAGRARELVATVHDVAGTSTRLRRPAPACRR